VYWSFFAFVRTGCKKVARKHRQVFLSH